MNPEKIKALEFRLIRQREAVLAAIRHHLHRDEDADDTASVDQAADASGQAESGLFNETDIAQVNLEGLELQDIDAALLRIKEGRYGRCIECGEAISADRLEAQPAAATCITCQTAFEKRHGIAHGTSK